MTRLLISFLARVVGPGALEITTASGARHRVGTGTGVPLAIHFVDRAAERQLLIDPALQLGELYMDGRLVVTKGSVYDFLDLAIANMALQSSVRLVAILDRLRKILRRVGRKNGVRRSSQNVAHHYDLDVRLFDLFLDPDHQYSCAYFEFPDQCLGDAQLAKKRHIAAKLLVEPGHRVLDIGSGWGGLALYLAERCGALVTGVTLSQEQLGVARSWALHQGFEAAVDFQLQDYRAVIGPFDRIVSVGMFEHVGPAHYGNFFHKLANILADDGVVLLHSIGSSGVGGTNPWIDKYIFPGGYVPALSEVLPAIERAGLIVTDIEVLRLHYAETLKAWRERFVARRYDALGLTDERFCRMWEFYLAACEASFRHGGLMVFQIQLAKRVDDVPLTRDYIAQREAELRLKEGETTGVLVAAE